MKTRKLSDAQTSVINILKSGGSLSSNKTSTLIWLLDHEGTHIVIHAGTFLGLVRRHIVVIDKIIGGKRYYRLDTSHKQVLELREWPCPECETGEMQQIGYTTPSGLTHYECSDCSYTTCFP